MQLKKAGQDVILLSNAKGTELIMRGGGGTHYAQTNDNKYDGSDDMFFQKFKCTPLSYRYYIDAIRSQIPHDSKAKGKHVVDGLRSISTYSYDTFTITVSKQTSEETISYESRSGSTMTICRHAFPTDSQGAERINTMVKPLNLAKSQSSVSKLEREESGTFPRIMYEILAESRQRVILDADDIEMLSQVYAINVPKKPVNDNKKAFIKKAYGILGAVYIVVSLDGRDYDTMQWLTSNPKPEELDSMTASKLVVDNVQARYIVDPASKYDYTYLRMGGTWIIIPKLKNTDAILREIVKVFTK